MKLKKFNGATDYNKLNHLPFNRNFSVRKDLIDSINNFGFLTPIILIETSVIDGQKKLYIADGQHRAITAAFLNIEFYGVIVDYDFNSEESIVNYIARLNSGQKPWKAIDYAESFAYLGNNEYKTLLKITNESPFTVDTIASLLNGISSKGNANNKIKNGTFKCIYLEQTKYTLSLCAVLSKYEKLTSRMVLALNYVCSLKQFNENKFIEQYKLNAKQVKELKLDDYNDIFSSWL